MSPSTKPQSSKGYICCLLIKKNVNKVAMVTFNSNGRGTKGSHFVWRKYLEPFSNSNKIIFGYNLHESKLSPIPIADACKKNDIYRLNKKISKYDIQLFQTMFYNKNSLFQDDSNKLLMELIGFLNNDPSPFCIMPAEYKEVLLNQIESNLDEVTLSRNQEELFTFYENNFLSVYKLLISKNSAFFNDLYAYKNEMLLGYNAGRTLKLSNFLHHKITELMSELLKQTLPKKEILILRRKLAQNQRAIENHMRNDFIFCNDCFLSVYNFLTFLITQMLRTKRIKDRIVSIEKTLISTDNTDRYREFFKKYNYESLFILLVHCASFNIGISMIENEYKILFLENESNHHFITSDQPIINTYVKNNDLVLLKSNEFEIYYPISPKLAILFTNNKKYKDINSIKSFDDEVSYYNKLLASSAWHFVYGLEKKDVIASLRV